VNHHSVAASLLLCCPDLRVSMSVCLFARIGLYLKNDIPNFTKISVRGRGSVLL